MLPRVHVGRLGIAHVQPSISTPLSAHVGNVVPGDGLRVVGIG